MAGLSIKTQRELAQAAAEFYANPYGFVMWAYPWGEQFLADGSFNPLRDKKGPEPWQRRLLLALGDHIRENGDLTALGLDKIIARFARASGHGVGKSALVAWLIHFLMGTRRDTRGVVTANTANQLETKTWPELAKWHNMFMLKDWFTWTATSYYFSLYPEERRKNYMVNAITVSENNTEAFAGMHNEGNAVFFIFDEASGIFPKLWEVVEGGLTDGEGFFFAFGNPTQPTSEFAKCFDDYKMLYNTEHVDSREVSHTNKQALNDMIRKWGEDSDEVKVRIKGLFPNQSYNGFISLDIVEQAISRENSYDGGAALIMGIDVARGGEDDTVFCFRQGRDCRSRPMVSVNKLSTTRVTDLALRYIKQYQPDCVVIESTGPGAGVIDQLKDRGVRVREVHPGALASKPGCFRKRDEMWSDMRDWLTDEGGCIPDDRQLVKELTAIEYTLDKVDGAYRLEDKELMKKRTGLSSPDRADSLALTFGVKILRRDSALNGRQRAERNTAITEYDPMAY